MDPLFLLGHNAHPSIKQRKTPPHSHKSRDIPFLVLEGLGANGDGQSITQCVLEPLPGTTTATVAAAVIINLRFQLADSLQ
jgi:hypothetical protein